MTNTRARLSLLAGPLAVVLWAAGIFGISHHQPGDHATGAQILAWYRSDTNWILLGGWLFMLGCLAFVWFAAVLRGRLVQAEGRDGSFATVAFTGAVAAATLGLLIPAADLAGAIDKSDIDATTAATFHRLSDAFFVTTELGLIVPFVAVSLLAWRTRILPRFWAAFGLLCALVLAIGPIGWAALIFGTPVWVIGTTVILVARRPRAVAVPATA